MLLLQGGLLPPLTAAMPSSKALSSSLLLLFLQFLPCLTQSKQTVPQSDAVSLLAFKLKADLDNTLNYTLKLNGYCYWQGVKCGEGGRVVRLFLPSSRLRGIFHNGTLSNLERLRVLNLRNNSLSGPLPDLSRLLNLRSLILSDNHFSYSFPPSIVTLHRLSILDLSYNNLSGPLPPSIASLELLSSLNLEQNHFDGHLPSLNQSLLETFNVSGNSLSGPIPLTSSLSRFGLSSFLGNPGLCGQIVSRVCADHPPFFNADHNASAPGNGTLSEGEGENVVVASPNGALHRRWASRNAAGFIVAIAVSILIVALMAVLFAMLLKRNRKYPKLEESGTLPTKTEQVGASITPSRSETQNAGKPAGGMLSGRLIFCSDKEVEGFTMEELMRASAELLGRGTIATTYKAVVEGRTTVTVKRVDSSKTWKSSGNDFERHMEILGRARHPNLVPLLAYFQADGERLLVYRFHPNGSLFNLIHGSKSARAKPLHWTSCLKIAEDVAQGLLHIHEVCKLVHGNVKASNVLLGADFEACVTDYCLTILLNNSCAEDSDCVALKAPENRNSERRATSQSDVYQYGVLILELLSGQHPSKHPFVGPSELLEWVRGKRDDDSEDYKQLGMLTEVASVCSVRSPEQRPTMRQVVNMIHEIKESVLVEGNGIPDL